MKNTKKYIDTMLEGLVKMPYKLIKNAKKNPEEFFLRAACKAAESKKMDAAFRLIPVKEEKFTRARLTLTTDSFAIVMQGPIRCENDFTVETVKFYKRLYPNAEIIVSTWKDENEEEIKKVQNAGAEVLLCEKPSTGGHLNINYQLKNTCEGIYEAQKKGVQYIAKTRTDQRISKPYVFEYMINLMKQYPTGDSSKQKQRLIALSMNYGNMFYPYFMSDFFYFGTAEDMGKLFTITSDNREPFKMPLNSTRRQYSDGAYAPEVYIMKNYLKRMGCTGDGSIEDYWSGVSRYLICVDLKMLDIYWPKYDGKYKLHEFYGDYFESDSAEKVKTMNFDFVNWLNLYTGTLKYSPEYEKYADVIFK